MATKMTIQGSGAGPFYVMDNSGLYPVVLSVNETQLAAEQSLLSVAQQQQLAAGTAFSSIWS